MWNGIRLIRFRVSNSWMAYTSITTKTENPSNIAAVDRSNGSAATKRIECPLVFRFEIRFGVTLEASK